MQTQIFDRCASRYDSLVDTNLGALSFTEGECYVGGFVFVDRPWLGVSDGLCGTDDYRRQEANRLHQRAREPPATEVGFGKHLISGRHVGQTGETTGIYQ